MKFQKGNKAAKGGRHNPPGGRPSKEEVVPKDELVKASSPPASSPPPAPEYELLFQGISNPKKRGFLAALVQCGSVTEAAKQAEIHWSSHYKWLREADNVAYTDAFNRAREIAGDIAEGEVYRRAILGFDHPVIYEGKITTTYKDYSDTLAMFWLKGLKPERYRENLNLSRSVGLPVDDFYNRIAERKREEKKS